MSTNMITNSVIPGTKWISPAVHWASPKIVEITRQISRLKAAEEFAKQNNHDDIGLTSLTSCMALLSSLSTVPIPIPVAGWSMDSGPSLFFEQNGFYGDLEITENTIEYYLKWQDERGVQQDVYETETIVDGRIPPKLLTHLFKMFVRA